jgi:hypothetical protein
MTLVKNHEGRFLGKPRMKVCDHVHYIKLPSNRMLAVQKNEHICIVHNLSEKPMLVF